MKLEPGRSVYPIEPVGMMSHVFIEDGDGLDSVAYQVQQIDSAEWRRLQSGEETPRKKMSSVGIPVYFALLAFLDPFYGWSIGVWPAPTRALEMKVAFYPPLKVI